ncbi:MAG TPA: tripartite tricarboxylate transporter substrate binding protein [Herbaspirillum sp.]|jgi:tripartite-type tricarboxylate transporter receptor subunit TctC
MNKTVISSAFSSPFSSLINYLVRAISFAILLGLGAQVQAEDYPVRPIKIIVPYAAGATTDLMARLVAEKLRDKLGQPVIVDNRSGAGGNIGAEIVSRAAPDGYTLLLSAAGPLVLNKNLYTNLAYDSDAFVPVSVIASSNSALVVNPKLGITTVAQLIAYAKANPGKLNYASSGVGSTPHLAAELFNAMAGVQITHVPYKGSGPAIVDVLAGHIDMTFVELSLALPQIQAGRVRLLAIGSEKRKAAMPDVPTIAETLPGYLSVTWFGLVAPPKTPPAITAKLSAAIGAALKEADVVKRMSEMNVEGIGDTPAEMKQFMAQESARWGKVILSSGMKVSE